MDKPNSSRGKKIRLQGQWGKEMGNFLICTTANADYSFILPLGRGQVKIKLVTEPIPPNKIHTCGENHEMSSNVFST